MSCPDRHAHQKKGNEEAAAYKNAPKMLGVPVALPIPVARERDILVNPSVSTHANNDDTTG